ncbi:MAG TPA: MarR family winged helix-turn-helix transcriptional regulator [Solirubrobacter sp.]|nr:MarR family winged helix-turn-helix transcriptional regulator [Solirubrobacter sp.]
MSASPPESSIVLLIRLSKAVYRHASEDALGIRLKEFVMLSNLRDGARAQSELCAAMHIDPNNCVLLLNDLEAAGHAERKRDPADRRRHIVEITPAGRKALVRAERALEGLEGEVLGALSADERAVLRDLLSRAFAGEQAAAA